MGFLVMGGFLVAAAAESVVVARVRLFQVNVFDQLTALRLQGCG
jgi:hypothetical protein